MQPDTEQLMKKLHTSLCPDKLEAEIRDKFLALEAEIERQSHIIQSPWMKRDALQDKIEELTSEEHSIPDCAKAIRALGGAA